MNRIQRKKLISIIMVLAMTFTMTSCGNSSGTQAEKGEAYEESIITIDGVLGYINGITVTNGDMYIWTYEAIGFAGDEDEYEYWCNNRLYSANEDGNNFEEIPLDLTEEFPLGKITSVMAREDGTITLWLSSDDFTADDMINVLITFDRNGKELVREDVNQSVDGQYVNKALMTPQGRIVAITENNVYIFNEEFKPEAEIRTENQLIDIALSKDGQLICANKNDKGKIQIQVLDLERVEWGKTILLEKNSLIDSHPLMDGSEYDFYYRNDSGIYGYDMEEEKATGVMDNEKSNVAAEDIQNCISMADGTFLAILFTTEELYDTRIAAYTKSDSSSAGEKTIITLGAFQLDESIKRAAIAFNKSNSQYQIVFKEYVGEDEEGEAALADAITRLNTDIAAGDVPDILDLNFLTERYAAKELFEDLTPYFEKDAELSEEDLIDSVLEAMKVDGKLYYISPDFKIATLIGKTKDVGKTNGWTMEDVYTFYEKQESDAMLFFADSKSDLLDIFLQGILADFYDWDSGECNFDSPGFKEILEFCNLAVSDENEIDSNQSNRDLFQEGKVLLMNEWVLTPWKIREYTNLLGSDFTYIGYPNKEKQGSYFSFDNRIGIYSQSEVKDGAWEFLRTLMTYEYQQQYLAESEEMASTPIRQDCFERLMKKLSDSQEYTDDMDNQPLTQEQIQQFQKLVENTKKSINYDVELMSIIQEEAAGYFAGEKSVDETVGIIQNRCSTYINENK